MYWNLFVTNKKPSILLAEDNKANQIISKAMIETIGSTVEIAENGLEVLQKLQEQVFDLIVMDCQMPEMDGLEAVKKIRSLDNQRLASIKVLALTADNQSDTRDACLTAGMDDFLSKPFTLEQIAEKINKWAKTVN